MVDVLCANVNSEGILAAADHLQYFAYAVFLRFRR